MEQPQATAPVDGVEQQQTEAPPESNGGDPAAQEVIRRRQPKPLSLRDPGQLARAFAESGYWKHVTKPAQAVVIMAHGEELGLSPLASMQGITIIENRIGYMGNLINQLIAKHPRYSVKKIERSNEGCTLQFLIDGQPPEEPEEGVVTFTIEDAERMELVKPRSNWVKTPRNMCFYRCLTEGSRVHFPDLTLGTPVYSTEEIEEVIHVEAQDVEVSAPRSESAASLDPDRVAHLVNGIEIVRPTLDEEGLTWVDGLNLRLGALGIDALSPTEEIDAQLTKLTEQQFEVLDADLQALADEMAGEGEEVSDAEVVGETQEGGEADA